MSHAAVTMMSNVDVGCSGFEVFSDGFQDGLPWRTDPGTFVLSVHWWFINSNSSVF